ncbi:META domain-containing protein [Sphingomonas humi]|uniref:DUF306 domain-containing protein n=1 Tax=Sphingomonas humi TaxID=335630 RepID=A0ABP7S562_9SPHN
MRALALAAAAAMLSGCATLPAAPVEGDTSYKAVGTEPFWALKLDGRQMVFSEAGSGVPVIEPQPKAIHGFAGDIYQGRRINVNIVHGQRCSDGMSDRVYADRVQVRVDGRAFEGCGGEVATAPSIAGTSWLVDSVNGRTVAGGERYFVRFTNDAMQAKFGCNSISGSARQEGAQLVTGGLAMTRMACPDMRDETEAGRILQSPAQLSWGPDGRLSIDNAAGRIVLRRAN